MASIAKRLLAHCTHSKIGLPLFGAAALVTAGIVINPLVATQDNPPSVVQGAQGPAASGPKAPVDGTNGTNPQQARATLADEVMLTSKLSQHKISQNGGNEVYLTFSMTSPEIEPKATQAATGTDLVVVLDRSGSMSDPQKLPYAKSAVKKLVERLSDADRFALISFDDRAVTSIPLQTLSPDARHHINQTVDRLHPGGGTNIHHGVASAWQLLKADPSNRTRKVILLSDGEATKGDTSVSGLRQVASLARQHEGMLSAIGMGLGFNEVVMSSMADHGMGNFAYLEHLEQLGTILAKDLQDTQNTYAASSHLSLPLPQGITLVDAAGYPVSREGNVLTIATGRLRSGVTKQFTVTLRVDNQNITEYALDHIHMTYTHAGEYHEAALNQAAPVIAVLPPEKRDEALASIDKDTYSKVWQENNVGRMRHEVNKFLRRGDQAQAKATIANYRQQVEIAEDESGVALMDSVAPELDDISASVEEAFSGSAAEQKIKRNRFAKESHAQSLKKQRKSVP